MNLKRNVNNIVLYDQRYKNIYKPYFGQSLNNKKIFFSRAGGFGDILFINPILNYLKEQYPTCKIFFSCNSQYRNVLKRWDSIDEVLQYPITLQKFNEFDHHAIFDGLIENNKKSEELNVYDMFFEYVGLFDVEDIKKIPKQKPNEYLFKDIKYILKNISSKFIYDAYLKKDFILLQLSTNSPIRSPRPLWWASVINELLENNYKIIIVDLPNNHYKIDNILNRYVKNRNNVFNFSQFSVDLDWAITIASQAKLVLGPDSSLIHIGASLNVPIIGIYGAFPGKIRVKYYKGEWIEPNISCSPCFTHGHSIVNCKNSLNGYPQCYDKIKSKDVIKIIKDVENKYC